MDKKMHKIALKALYLILFGVIFPPDAISLHLLPAEAAVGESAG